MIKYKNNKKSFIGVICIVLVAVLSVGSLAFLSSGFRDWGVKDWFSGLFDKTSNEETDDANFFNPYTFDVRRGGSSDIEGNVSLVEKGVKISNTSSYAFFSRIVPIDISTAPKTVVLSTKLVDVSTGTLSFYFQYHKDGYTHVSKTYNFALVEDLVISQEYDLPTGILSLSLIFRMDFGSSRTVTLSDFKIIEKGKTSNLTDARYIQPSGGAAGTISDLTATTVTYSYTTTTTILYSTMYLTDLADNQALAFDVTKSSFIATAFSLVYDYVNLDTSVPAKVTQPIVDKTGKFSIKPDGVDNYKILRFCFLIQGNPVTLKFSEFKVYGGDITTAA